MANHELSPVQRWRAAAPWLPPLSGPAATAEALLLLVHYSVDFEGWVGQRISTYWENILPSRAVAATYRTTTLDWWWTEVTNALDASPRTASMRREIAILLRQDPQPVLEGLRRESTALVLRVRLIAEAVRGQRQVEGKTV